MIWTKVTHETAKFQTFNCSHKASPKLYFDRVILLKLYKISAEKVFRIYMSFDTEDWRKIQRKSDLLFQK